MDSVLRKFGSKYRHLSRILPLLDIPHTCFADVFFGGGSVSFAKPPAPVEVFNDLDGKIVRFFRVLQDPDKRDRLRELSILTPYSRQVFEEFKAAPAPSEPVEFAYWFFVLNRMSFAGGSKSWSYCKTEHRQGLAASLYVWLKGVDGLYEVSCRLLSAQIERQHFRDFLPRYDGPETLFYLDPPYHPETRVSGGYDVEMTAKEHEELTAMLLGLEGMAVLSGYRHACHAPLEAAGWKRNEEEVVISASGAKAKKTKRRESIWMNPAAVDRHRAKATDKEEIVQQEPLALFAA